MVHKPHNIMTVEQVMHNVQGLIAFECREILSNSFVEIDFFDLRPSTNYTVYAVADSTKAKNVPITDDDKIPEHLVLSTLPEVLDIEWHRLTPHMQAMEIKAALRTSWLQEAAAAHFPMILLPTDEDVKNLENRPNVDEPVTGANLPSTPKSPKPTTKGSRGKNRVAGSADEKPSSTWSTFLDWWAGSNPHVVSKIRSEFHLKEALFMAQQEAVLTKYKESGFATNEEIGKVGRYAVSISANLASGKIKKENVPKSADFNKFRSWYKGGQVIRDSMNASMLSTR
jgi:hypothetical protein